MLQRQHDRVLQDFSPELREARQWKAGELRRLYFPKDVTAFAYDPVVSLLAVGTAKGSIHIFGRPGVHIVLTSASHISVKFLLFSASTSRIACLDNDNQLSIWDLSSFGQPKLLATARFDQTNCILTSPSHSHVFLVIHTGEVRAYDLLCLRKSPYTLPNLWDIYKRKTASTVSEHEQSSRTSVEIVPHPRDLNLLFVAYAGGVVLSDLTQREVIRTYEYTVPPGAPGGTGYEGPDVLTLRQPSVTCMAIHPAGHFFAVGYTDGSVGFWALEDEDQPLLVKTLDADDVNIVNNETLDRLLSSPGRTGANHTREPVFKLSWSGFSNSSDPRGRKTVLTILGGLNIGESPGLTIFELPAFNPLDPPPSSPLSDPLHPHFRCAMRESLVPLKTYFYPTQDVVQDYLLVPRDSPHYTGALDPIAIILMTGSDANVRRLTAFEYPPPAFKEGESDDAHKSERSAVGPDELATELAATLQSLLESNEPRNLRIPAPLWISAAGLVYGHLLTVDRSTYQTYAEDVQLESRLNLNGGNAWADATRENDMAFSKYQPHRLMVTYNKDSTVHVLDLSAQLLTTQISEQLRPKTLENEFPNVKSALTIDICTVFGDPHVATVVHADEVPRISSLDFSPGYACAIGVETGHLIVFRDRNSTTIAPCANRELLDVELIPLGHIEAGRGKRHAPHFIVSQTSKHIEISSISNVGLLAVSYSDGSVLVADIADPHVVWRHDPPKKKSRHSINLHIMSENVVDPVVDLLWTVCGIDKDPQLRLRLLAIHLSGRVDIIAFVQGADDTTWKTFNEPVQSEAISNPLQHGSFVLDGKTGMMLKATRERLFLTSQQSTSDTRCIFVTTGTKGARVFAEINGQRISKVNWSSDSGHIQTTQIVERMGSYALVAFTDKHLALVYALPYLEYLHTLELPPVPSLPPSVDSSGDFVVFSPHPMSGQIHEALYGTLFDFRRVYSQPDVELIPSPPKIPSQPQPVSLGPASLLSAWFRYSLSMTGEQLDALVGGPDRPVPRQESRSTEQIQNGGSQAAELASKAAAVQGELYGRLTSALSERGHMLDDLGERFNALEAGSRSMVTQAKKLAARQSAKSWLGL
ncbi:WD40 containing snare-dependent exocytosis protein [Amanita muscaria]